MSEPRKSGITSIPDNVRELLEYKPPAAAGHGRRGRYHAVLTAAWFYAPEALMVGCALFLLAAALLGQRAPLWQQLATLGAVIGLSGICAAWRHLHRGLRTEMAALRARLAIAERRANARWS